MKKISLKIKYDQLKDLELWLGECIKNLAYALSMDAKCVCAILIKIHTEKVLPKTLFWYKGHIKMSFHAHEAYAMAYCMQHADFFLPYDFEYLKPWLQSTYNEICNHNFLNK